MSTQSDNPCPAPPPETTGLKLDRNNPFDKAVIVVMLLSAAFVVVAVAAGAIARYVFRRDIYGIEELTTIAAFWMYFTGAIYATKTRQQISAEMLSAFIKRPRVLYAFALLQRIVTFLLCLIFTWWGWEFFHWSLVNGGKTNLWQIPVIVGQGSVFIGFVGMLLYLARDVIMLLRVRPSTYSTGAA